MDDETDPVQPDGQGGEGGSTGGQAPWADYLSRIPEEARSEVEPVFRDWDANYTKQSQKAAEYRRQWEPLEEAGIHERDPEVVKWGVQFAEALEHPEQIKQWYDEYARERGISDATVDPNGLEEYVDPQVAELRQQMQQLQGALAPQVAELAEWRNAQESARMQAAQDAQLKSQMDVLREKDDFNETLVTDLMHKYRQEDPEHAVERAYADSQAIQAQILKEWTQGKANQPPGAQSGGVADGAPEPISTMKQAREAALIQLRAGMS